MLSLKAIVSHYQRPLILAAIGLLLLLVLLTRSPGHASLSAATPSPRYGGGLKEQAAFLKGNEKLYSAQSQSHLLDDPHGGYWGNTASVHALSEFAHRFQSPDDFWPHFKNIRQLSPVSVNETKRTCTWRKEDMDGMQFTWGTEMPWVTNDTTIDATEEKRREWMKFFEDELVPWEKVKHRFSGRGIITSAGNAGTLKRVAILLRQLIRLGSKLPVEVHYWADELDAKDMKYLTDIYPKTTFSNLAAAHQIWKTHGPIITYGHFNFKTAACVNTKFAEFLMIDSDNLPIVNPDTLFETATYKEYGSLFWPDIARTRANNPFWAITRTFCKMDEYEQESGQLVVDKRRFFYHLQLAAWFNEYEFFRHLVLGDKDMFRFAWHALKTKYGRPSKWLTNAGFVHDGKYCGHSFAQRHPDGPVAFMHRGLFKLHTKQSIKYVLDRGGFYTAYKTGLHDTDPAFPQKTRFTFDGVEGIKNIWHCMDIPETEHRDINEIIPGMEQMFADLGGYWQLEENVNDVTGLLEPKESKREEVEWNA